MTPNGKPQPRTVRRHRVIVSDDVTALEMRLDAYAREGWELLGPVQVGCNDSRALVATMTRSVPAP